MKRLVNNSKHYFVLFIRVEFHYYILNDDFVPLKAAKCSYNRLPKQQISLHPKDCRLIRDAEAVDFSAASAASTSASMLPLPHPYG